MQLLDSRNVGESTPGQLTTSGAAQSTTFVLLDPRSNPSEHKLLTPYGDV